MPPLPAAELPESAALLYAPASIHHDYLEARSVAQLSRAGATHLKMKLAAHFGGVLFEREAFDDYAVARSSRWKGVQDCLGTLIAVTRVSLVGGPDSAKHLDLKMQGGLP